MIYLCKRLRYALRFARIGFWTGWRAHLAIHKLAQSYRISPDMQYVTTPAVSNYLHDAMAQLAADKAADESREDREVEEWLNGD